MLEKKDHRAASSCFFSTNLFKKIDRRQFSNWDTTLGSNVFTLFIMHSVAFVNCVRGFPSLQNLVFKSRVLNDPKHSFNKLDFICGFVVVFYTFGQ